MFSNVVRARDAARDEKDVAIKVCAGAQNMLNTFAKHMFLSYVLSLTRNPCSTICNTLFSDHPKQRVDAQDWLTGVGESP